MAVDADECCWRIEKFSINVLNQSSKSFIYECNVSRACGKDLIAAFIY